VQWYTYSSWSHDKSVAGTVVAQLMGRRRLPLEAVRRTLTRGAVRSCIRDTVEPPLPLLIEIGVRVVGIRPDEG
jgi:hypothetical protein